MRTLYLHIGLPKTGSSWIQSSLFRSKSVLACHGIKYPDGPLDFLMTEMPEKGMPNVERMFRKIATYRSALEPYADSPCHLFFSNEDGLDEIYETSALGEMVTIAGSLGFDRIEMILFIRDPIPFAVSFYKQRVSTWGYTGALEDEFDALQFPERVAWLMEEAESLEQLSLTVRRYETVGAELLPVIEDWLMLPRGSLLPPPISRTNRSLTRSELVLQRALNRHIGHSRPRSVQELGRGLIALDGSELLPTQVRLQDWLGRRLPDTPPDKLLPAREVQERMCARLQPAIDRINALLPEEHWLRCEIRDPEPQEARYTMTEEQLDLIGDVLGTEIARLRRNPPNPADAYGGRVLLKAMVERIRRRILQFR